MLKQRVITAIVLVAILLGALFGLTAFQFSWFMGAIVLIGAWEWSNLASFGKAWQRVLYVALIAGLLIVFGYHIGVAGQPEHLRLDAIKALLVIGCGWWAIALLLVQGYPSSAILWGHPFLRLTMGIFVLVPTWVALVYVRFQPHGAWLIVMIMGIVAAADIGGYFSGRRFGRHKLAASVSPGKTLEGFAGGLVSNLLLAGVIAYLSGNNVWILLAIIVPTSLFSVLGDLLESMVKRFAGVKDSGVILPGHGGVLDRVDSVTAAAPVFALALLASGWTLGQ